MEDRLLRLESKVDNLTEVVIRMDEQQKRTHELLIKHDAKGQKALDKAEGLEDRMDAQEAMWRVPYKWTKILAAIAGSITAMYTAWKILGK